MDIICTVYRSGSRSHLSDNGLPPYVSIIFILSLYTSFNSRSDHWQDVTAGSILGTVLAYFCYRQYYPNLASKFSHHPYSPRIKHEDIEILPSHSCGGSHDIEDHIRHNGHHDVLAGTVPRPEPEHLEDVWRDDGVNAAEEENVGLYKDSLRLDSRMSVSNEAP